jgi:hypothetical protein
MIVYAASFQLPTLPAGNDASRPDWILLDTMGYISDCQNATKAEAYTSTEKKVMVSFFVAEPPAVSHFSVYCPELKKEDFVREPHVVHSEQNLALLTLTIKGGKGTDYFIYRARSGHPPSLDLIPDAHRQLSKIHAVPTIACVPYGDGDYFVLAALGITFRRGEYEFSVFRSELGTWTYKLLVFGTSVLGPNRITLCPAKVIMLGGGEIGWVDLWNGILICDMFKEDPDFRVVPVPKMLPANHVYKQNSYPQQFRDVICTDGLITLVEMEYCRRRIIHEIPDVSEAEVLYDSELPLGEAVDDEKDTYEYLGWRVVTWNRESTSNC